MLINNYHQINFGEKFRTKDILSFMTGYPISDASKKPQFEANIIKALTGININEDSFKKTFSGDTTIGQIAIQSICIENMIEQNRKLQNADQSAGKIFFKVPKNQREIAEWTNSMVEYIGNNINLKPFNISNNELRERYHTLIEIMNLIF